VKAMGELQSTLTAFEPATGAQKGLALETLAPYSG